jgi:hypothetical protein
VLEGPAVSRRDLGESPPAAGQGSQVLGGQLGHPAAEQEVAALSELGHELEARAAEAQEDAPSVHRVAAALDEAGADQAVGEEAGGWEADVEELG